MFNSPLTVTPPQTEDFRVKAILILLIVLIALVAGAFFYGKKGVVLDETLARPQAEAIEKKDTPAIDLTAEGGPQVASLAEVKQAFIEHLRDPLELTKAAAQSPPPSQPQFARAPPPPPSPRPAPQVREKSLREQMLEKARTAPVGIALPGVAEADKPGGIVQVSSREKEISGKYIIAPGTYMIVGLATEVRSEKPGTITAKLLYPVKDATQTVCLIPQGATLTGINDEVAQAGDSLLTTHWTNIWITSPSGRLTAIDLQKMEAHNSRGSTGVEGTVNRHILSTFGTALALGGISAITQIGLSRSQSPGTLSLPNAAGAAVSTELGRVANRSLQQNLNRPPTITEEQGDEFVLITSEPIQLESTCDDRE